MSNKVENIIASTFMEMAQGLETGSFGKRPKIALAGIGSELGEENALAGAKLATKAGVDVIYIGTLEAEGVDTIKVATEEEGHKKVEQLLKEKEIDGAVAMHFPFPIGVSTVGRVVTPAKGKEMFIATTTGTASADRIEGMIKNAIYGVIAAKACGYEKPTVGILNVDGARQAEIALKKLKEQGYEIEFAQSGRSDGGCILRGNDALQGSADVLVCDPLSGNVLMKMLSSYTTGGNYESLGYGYGPGIGQGYDELVMIISRASGAPVISGALQYASELVSGKVFEVAKGEFKKADQSGLKKLLEERKKSDKKEAVTEEVVAPPKEVVTSEISGIEIMDLEDGVQVLWKIGIYAESGMGCTGPIILVSEKNLEKATEELKKEDFIQ
jgi:hypothetical protein